MKYVLIILLMLVIFIISVTFSAHNDQVVTFNYLLAQSQFRVSTLITLLFSAGFVIGWVIFGLFWLRTRLALMRAECKVKRLEQKLAKVETLLTVPASTPAVAPKE